MSKIRILLVEFRIDTDESIFDVLFLHHGIKRRYI